MSADMDPDQETVGDGATGTPRKKPNESAGLLIAYVTVLLMVLAPFAISSMLDEFARHVDGGESGPESTGPAVTAAITVGLLGLACLANIVYAERMRKAVAAADPAESSGGHDGPSGEPRSAPALLNVALGVLTLPALLFLFLLPALLF